MIRRLLIAGAIAVTALAIAAGQLPNMPAPAGMLAENIRGMRPSYAPARVAAVPNETAIRRRFWVPELDAGYTPQGLAALADETIHLAREQGLEAVLNLRTDSVQEINRRAGVT